MKILKSTPLEISYSSKGRNTMAVADFKRFDLAFSFMTGPAPHAWDKQMLYFGVMHPVINGGAGADFKIQLPTLKSLKGTILITLKHLDPRPAYTLFAGRDCDHSTGTYARKHWTHWHAFNAMKAACEDWQEGPCGWRFISKKEYNEREF